VDADDEAALLAAYRLCWRITAAHRLLTDRPLDPDRIGEGAGAFLARETGVASVSDLAAALAERTEAADRAISRLLSGANDD